MAFQCTEQPPHNSYVAENGTKSRYHNIVKATIDSVIEGFNVDIMQTFSQEMTYGSVLDALKIHFHPNDADMIGSKLFYIHEFMQDFAATKVDFPKGGDIIEYRPKHDEVKTKGKSLESAARILHMLMFWRIKDVQEVNKISQDEMEGILYSIFYDFEIDGTCVESSEGRSFGLNPYLRAFKAFKKK